MHTHRVRPYVWFLMLVLLGLSAVKAGATEGPSFPSNEHPTYSPDGKQIAFESDALGGFDIWIASVDGSNLRRLTQGMGSTQKDPAWSPDGTQIAFASNKSGNFNIWVIRTDGSNLTQLTAGPSIDDQPAWSPNGTMIAFVSNRGGTKDVWMMDSTGGNLRRLTSLAGQENHPSFSPLGDRVVFSETTAQRSNLMIINTDATGLRFLTTGIFRDLDPTWTTLGVLFSTDRDAAGFAVWLIQSDGSGLQQIQNSRHGLEPVLSPDGMFVTFTSEQEDGSQNIVATNPITGSTKLITNVKGFFVDILIKPERESTSPARIKLSRHGKIAVAILSSRNFNASTEVDKASLTFGSTGDEKSLGRCDVEGDVNDDDLPDLTCFFRTAQTGFSLSDTIAILRGQTTRGVRIEGRAAVRIVPKDSDESDE